MLSILFSLGRMLSRILLWSLGESLVCIARWSRFLFRFQEGWIVLSDSTVRAMPNTTARRWDPVFLTHRSLHSLTSGGVEDPFSFSCQAEPVESGHGIYRAGGRI